MRRYRLIPVLAVLLIIFWPFNGDNMNNAAAAAATGSVSISEDPVKGRITIETEKIKGVWHYKNLPEESNNQSGGSLYELYYKPLDPGAERNLVSFVRSPGWGNGGSANIWIGVGGVGGTNMYATNQLPSSSQTNSFADIIAENNLGGQLQQHSSYIDQDGNAVVKFVYKVRSQSSNSAHQAANGYWYQVAKEWKIEPGGMIRLAVTMTVLSDGYFSEPAIKANMSHYVGWDRYVKFGRDWHDTISAGYLLGHDGIPDGNGSCWDELNQFHPDWFAYLGSPEAPIFKMTADNDGLGFRNSGSYKLGLSAKGGSSLEQCSTEIEAGTLGTIGANAIAWFAWWGGNPPQGNRYAFLRQGTTWTDTFKIELLESYPGDGPDVFGVGAGVVDASRAQINWNTSEPANSVVEVKSPNGSWSVAGQDHSLKTSHSVIVTRSQGTDFAFRIKSKDEGGNLTVSSGYNFENSVSNTFVLNLSESPAYWSSYTDYINRLLKAELHIENRGPSLARSVNIESGVASKGVRINNYFPVALGDIPAGTSSSFTGVFSVAPGIGEFLLSLKVAGVGPNGERVEFPH